ncbi:alpha-ketoacid dehydrogenase subunit beta, partial [Ruminococcaceae bacterium OttesenSCG-928-I18]|nr:alpha-ketoacid dehydrogenase subunit beta [Ruminococcaceae bacterium OttesenSCG-928-I18]
VYPSTPQDAYGMMLACVEDDNPVMFVENKFLYDTLKGEVDVDAPPIPLGKADIKREGKDVTIVATGKMVHESLRAAEALEKEGMDIEVLDLRSLYPLDKDTIYASVQKTHRVIVTSEETKRGSYAGEISALISENIMDELDAPVKRVCALDTPIPFAGALESYFLPNADDIIKAVKEL